MQFSMSDLDFLTRLFVAGCCGAGIGYERTKRFKEAGIRTHIIVCCAAALMMIVSKYGFSDMTDANGLYYAGTRGADPARIAAQVVSGISFLGAGMIFKTGSSVKGLTTAAGVWFTAGVGIAIGSGMYLIGIAATLMIAIFQLVFHRFAVGADAYKTNYLLVVAEDKPEFHELYKNMIEGIEAQVTDLEISRKDGVVQYASHIKIREKITPEDISMFFQDNEDIKVISLKTS